jgi:hypothetical protein
MRARHPATDRLDGPFAIKMQRMTAF